MQGERDALLKLIQSLRHEYEAVQAAKLGQESEIQGLKVQSCPLSRCVDAAFPQCTSHLQQYICLKHAVMKRLMTTYFTSGQDGFSDQLF